MSRSDGLPLDARLDGSPMLVDNVQGRAFGVVRVRGTTHHPNTVGRAGAAERVGARRVDRHAPDERAAASIRLLRRHRDHRLDRRARRRSRARARWPRHQDAQPAVVRPACSTPTTRACWTTTRAPCARTSTRRSEGAVQPHVGVTGRVGVRNGVIVVPESDHKEVISARDPALYQVVDTSQRRRGERRVDRSRRHSWRTCAWT